MTKPRMQCACWVASVVFDPLWPRGLSPTRLLCPRDSPGKNTAVGCHFLLQGCIQEHWESGAVYVSEGFNCVVQAERHTLIKWHLPGRLINAAHRGPDSHFSVSWGPSVVCCKEFALKGSRWAPSVGPHFWTVLCQLLVRAELTGRRGSWYKSLGASGLERWPRVCGCYQCKS